MDERQRMFPIQGGHYPATAISPSMPYSASSIPWWLAEIAYRYYVKRFGNSQSLERIAERGGFGREELIGFLREGKVPSSQDLWRMTYGSKATGGVRDSG